MLPGIRGSLITLDRFVADGTWEQRIAESTQLAMAECNPECVETVSMDAVQQFVTDALRQAESQDARFLGLDPTRHGAILGTPASQPRLLIRGSRVGSIHWGQLRRSSPAC
jgi:hypothetical protein